MRKVIIAAPMKLIRPFDIMMELSSLNANIVLLCIITIYHSWALTGMVHRCHVGAQLIVKSEHLQCKRAMSLVCSSLPGLNLFPGLALLVCYAICIAGVCSELPYTIWSRNDHT